MFKIKYLRGNGNTHVGIFEQKADVHKPFRLPGTIQFGYCLECDDVGDVDGGKHKARHRQKSTTGPHGMPEREEVTEPK